MERGLLSWWYESGIVEKYLHRNDTAKENFSFIDGPITANNPMGVHHAWGRTYKDLWQRFNALRGKKERFQNGFDCQGLWVEVEVEKDLGFKSKKDIEAYGIANFVNKCKERVLKYSSIQTEQSKRLGYFMDWDHSYFTMSDENNFMIWHFLKVCFDRGWVYKGHESIPWCPRCETAISQHEMLTEDYKEVTHKAIYFALPIIGRDNEHLLVWTTTPWTLPANIAVAVDEKLDYVLVSGEADRKYWVVKGKESLFGKESKIEKDVKGKELVGLKYSGPFDDLAKVKKTAMEYPDKFHTVVATDPLIMPITTTEGTGLVHTAVSAGTEDFQLGKKLGLPMIPIIEDNADYMGDMDFLSGENAKKHPEVILDYLSAETAKGKPWVFKIENYTHRYPACWRCKTELVWKVADEWYIAMDKVDPTDELKRTLREQMIDVTKKISWLPEFGLDRELDWLKNMHDWLISKPNRYWGLALPIYECKKCGHFEVLGGREELKTRAVAGWEKFDGNSPHRPWIDEVKIKCSKCGELVSRTLDVGNPWLDAGIVPFSTLVDPKTGEVSYLSDKKYWQEWFPAEFITESFPGQFKNWFYSLIVMSTVLEKTNPFKTVLGFATMLDGKGKPFHKSAGNAIEFVEGADKFGADVVRWLIAKGNPAENILFDEKRVDEARRQFFLMLWNVYSFFVTYAMLDNWTPGEESNLDSDNILDKWILARLAEVTEASTKSLERFNSQPAILAIEDFANDLSLWYIRRSRDRVGPTAENGQDKTSFYRTAHHVLVTLTKILAPITPFIAEEMYRNLTGEESVHLAHWPNKVATNETEKWLVEKMGQVRKAIELGHALRKQEAIKVRQPLSDIFYSFGGKNEKYDPLIWMDLFKKELNVKLVVYGESHHAPVHSGHWVSATHSIAPGDISVSLRIDLNDQLIAEGQAREIVRQIQDARKVAGTAMDEIVVTALPDWPANFEDYIKKETLSQELKKGDTLEIIRTKT
jgi:isoleucyl-tRNA synthetase